MGGRSTKVTEHFFPTCELLIYAPRLVSPLVADRPDLGVTLHMAENHGLRGSASRPNPALTFALAGL